MKKIKTFQTGSHLRNPPSILRGRRRHLRDQHLLGHLHSSGRLRNGVSSLSVRAKRKLQQQNLSEIKLQQYNLRTNYDDNDGIISK
jgi:hypothetical protein